MRTIQVAFVGAVLLAVGYSLWSAAEAVQWFVAELLHTVLIAARICGGLVIFLVLVTCLWLLLRQQYERNRQRDGAFALREYWLEPLPRRALNWLSGRPSARAIYDPNANMSHAAVIHDAVYVVEPAAGWDRQLAYVHDIERTRRAQAVSPGDATLGLPWYGGGLSGRGGIPNAATGRLLAGAYDKRPSPPVVDAPQPAAQLPPPPPADLPLDYALERTETQAWPLGYDEAGNLAWFNPLLDAHAAVVGATGTGKTTSAGYLLACHALRQGWHVVVFDADDGASWSSFATQAECCPTSTDVFEAQIAALHAEFERRQGLLSEARAFDIGQLAGERRVLVVIEEYGDLSRTLRLRDRAAAQRVEGQMDTLMRRGRKAGVHLVLLDQYPEYWSNQLLANAKFRIVFQLGPNQGAKLEEYDAAKLPARGAFLLRGQRYTAWHTAPHLRRLLADVPALSAPARIIRTGTSTPPLAGANAGERTVEAVRAGVFTNAFAAVSPEVAPTPQPSANTANTIGKWYDFILNYMSSPRGAGLWNQPPTGVRELARAMSLAETGSRDGENSFVGIASKIAQQIRERRTDAAPFSQIDLSTDEGRAAFSYLAQDARLPNGARLGTDITGGV